MRAAVQGTQPKKPQAELLGKDELKKAGLTEKAEAVENVETVVKVEPVEDVEPVVKELWLGSRVLDKLRSRGCGDAFSEMSIMENGVVLRDEGFVIPRRLKKKTVVEIRVGDTVLVQQTKSTTQAVLKEKKESREKTAGGVLRRPQTDNDAKYKGCGRPSGTNKG